MMELTIRKCSEMSAIKSKCKKLNNLIIHSATLYFIYCTALDYKVLAQQERVAPGVPTRQYEQPPSGQQGSAFLLFH